MRNVTWRCHIIVMYSVSSPLFKTNRDNRTRSISVENRTFSHLTVNISNLTAARNRWDIFGDSSCYCSLDVLKEGGPTARPTWFGREQDGKVRKWVGSCWGPRLVSHQDDKQMTEGEWRAKVTGVQHVKWDSGRKRKDTLLSPPHAAGLLGPFVFFNECLSLSFFFLPCALPSSALWF